MRVIKKPITADDVLPPPINSTQTQFLWTEKGMISTASRLLMLHRTTDEQDCLDITIRPFKGSVSKVYHSEPATVTWYSKTMWREQTPTSDMLYTVARPNPVPQTAGLNKCGSRKS